MEGANTGTTNFESLAAELGSSGIPGEAQDESGEAQKDSQDFQSEEIPPEESQEASATEEEEASESGEAAEEDKGITLTREEYVALLQRIDDLSRKVKGTEEPERKPESDPDVPFLASDEEYDAALRSSSDLNKLLNKVRKQTIEDVYKRLPHVAANVAQSVYESRMAAIEFYKENEDLKPYATFVGNVTNELAALHPNKPVQELLKDVATEVRRRLKLKAVASSSPTKPKQKPAFVDGSKRRVTKDNLSRLEREIAELIS